MPENKPTVGRITQLGDKPPVANAVDVMRRADAMILKLSGELALTEERLRDLVEAAAPVLISHDRRNAPFFSALNAARTLLEGEGK